MAESQIRQTAYKVWITDLINGEYINPSGEWVPSYVVIKEKKVSRVNIIANVISKYNNEDSTYISLTLDDGSDNIQTKAWNEDTKILEKINIGDTILTIARVKEYGGKIYLVPEIVRKLDKKEWITLRKKELILEYGERKQGILPTVHFNEDQRFEQIQPKVVEESISDSPYNERQNLLNAIEKHDNGYGVEITKIVDDLGLKEEMTVNLIQDLLKEGEIFEIKPGKIKLIE